MNFNEKITQLRKQNNLSQEQLAEKLAVARQTISKWELGETTPEMDKLLKMSKIFHITLDELIKDEPIIKDSYTLNTSNSQKLAGIIIKILKGIGIFIFAFILLYILLLGIGFISFHTTKTIQETHAIRE